MIDGIDKSGSRERILHRVIYRNDQLDAAKIFYSKTKNRSYSLNRNSNSKLGNFYISSSFIGANLSNYWIGFTKSVLGAQVDILVK